MARLRKSRKHQPTHLLAIWASQAVKVEPEADAVFEQTCRNTLFDIFSLFGQLLVKQRYGEDEFDCSELACEYPTGVERIETTNPLSHTIHTLDGDLEDTMAEEAPWRTASLEIFIQGRKSSKPLELHRYMKHQVYRAQQTASNESNKCCVSRPNWSQYPMISSPQRAHSENHHYTSGILLRAW